MRQVGPNYNKISKEIAVKVQELVADLRKADISELPDVIYFVYQGLKVDITEEVYRDRV